MHRKHQGHSKPAVAPKRGRPEDPADGAKTCNTAEERTSIESVQGSNGDQPDSVRGERSALTDFDSGVETAHDTARTGDERSHDGSVERPGE
jgi:hypothetical protein